MVLAPTTVAADLGKTVGGLLIWSAAAKSHGELTTAGGSITKTHQMLQKIIEGNSNHAVMDTKATAAYFRVITTGVVLLVTGCQRSVCFLG